MGGGNAKVILRGAALLRDRVWLDQLALLLIDIRGHAGNREAKRCRGTGGLSTRGLRRALNFARQTSDFVTLMSTPSSALMLLPSLSFILSSWHSSRGAALQGSPDVTSSLPSALSLASAALAAIGCCRPRSSTKCDGETMLQPSRQTAASSAETGPATRAQTERRAR